MAVRLLKFLEKNRILNDRQYGFRAGRNTSTAIVEFLKYLYNDIDEGMTCWGIFLDLSKAFDLVNHGILLEKLCAYGVRGTVLEWFKSYLTERTHYVNVDNVCSDRLPVERGVPQGSVLGPLLYIIYVNDMPLSKSILFADDTSLLISCQNKSDIAQQTSKDLVTISDYMKKNNLIVNSKKTSFIEFMPNVKERVTSNLVRYENSYSIAQVDSTKFLGFVVDQRCRWDVHIDNLCKKLSSLCHVLRRLRSVVSPNVLLTYYYGHFHSVLSYAIIAWGSSPDVDRAFKLQKRAIRVMNNVGYRTSCKPYFASMKILPLPCVFIMELLLYAKDNLKNLTKISSHHSYNTRNDFVLEIPKHRLAFYEKNPHFLAIKAYNKLPRNFKDILSRDKFKSKIKKYLQQKCYYSLAEFLNEI